ncbi:hypothetical protein [Nocardia sp. NPDC127526]|uniref:hypothetical protein n=1 Tax=Nocardia sp. NPDC127526 TaxID=3345393 RepID=UPI0036381E09
MPRICKSGTVLKALVRQRDWTQDRFGLEYDRAAARVDSGMVGYAPNIRTVRRWLAGQVRPHIDHRHVLEAMFPGYTIDELLAPFDLSTGAPIPAPRTLAGQPAVTAAGTRTVWQCPPRLSFGGVCIWCDRHGCTDIQCVWLHESTEWKVCSDCGGAPWTTPEGSCGCLYGLVESTVYAVADREAV